MTFGEFKGYVNGYLKAARLDTKVKFHNDQEIGRFTAKVGGLFITGRPGTTAIAVKTTSRQYYVVRI